MTEAVSIVRPPRLALYEKVEAAAVLGLLLLSAVAASLAVYYAFQDFPQADELFRAAENKYGWPWSLALVDYQNGTGRWAAMIVHHLIEREDTIFTIYPLLLITAWTVMVLGYSCAFAVLFDKQLIQPSILTAGFALFVYLWLSCPTGETYFWLTATVEDALPLSLAATLFYMGRSLQSLSRTVFCCVLAFIIPGFHEVIGGWIVLPLAALCIAAIAWDRMNALRRGAIFACSLMGEAISASAPGNFQRLNLTPHVSTTGHLVDGVTAAFAHAGTVFFSWKQGLTVLLYVLAIAASSAERPRWHPLAPRFSASAVLILAFAVPLAFLCAPGAALQGFVPARMLDATYVVGCFGAICIATIIGFGAPSEVRRWLSGARGSIVRSIIVLTIPMVAVSLPRFGHATAELTLAEKNASIIKERVVALRSFGKENVSSTLVRDRLLPMETLPTYLDITLDDTDFRNQHYAFFLGFDCVRLASPEAVTGVKSRVVSGPACSGLPMRAKLTPLFDRP